LERTSHQLQEQLVAAQEARDALTAQQAGLQQQLADAHLSMAQLEQQQETFQSVQQVRVAVCWALGGTALPASQYDEAWRMRSAV